MNDPLEGWDTEGNVLDLDAARPDPAVPPALAVAVAAGGAGALAGAVATRRRVVGALVGAIAGVGTAIVAQRQRGEATVIDLLR